jgi:hypothetical protein
MCMEWKFNYIAITNSLQIAKILENCGIQQIMVDAEIIGKKERQEGRNTIISDHKINDIALLKSKITKSKIICRINPYYEDTFNEIEQAISLGVDCIMIPMIQDVSLYKKMFRQVDGRASIIPLIETPYSIFKLTEIVQFGSINQIHFGLNDLFLSLGMKNLFEVLLSPVFNFAISQVRSTIKITGFGGIGDPNTKQLISPSLLLNEHLKLGSNSVILSRSFFKNGYEEDYIKKSLNIFESIIDNGYIANYSYNLKREIEKI